MYVLHKHRTTNCVVCEAVFLSETSFIPQAKFAQVRALSVDHYGKPKFFFPHINTLYQYEIYRKVIFPKAKQESQTLILGEDVHHRFNIEYIMYHLSRKITPTLRIHTKFASCFIIKKKTSNHYTVHCVVRITKFCITDR